MQSLLDRSSCPNNSASLSFSLSLSLSPQSLNHTLQNEQTRLFVMPSPIIRLPLKAVSPSSFTSPSAIERRLLILFPPVTSTCSPSSASAPSSFSLSLSLIDLENVFIAVQTHQHACSKPRRVSSLPATHTSLPPSSTGPFCTLSSFRLLSVYCSLFHSKALLNLIAHSRSLRHSHIITTTTTKR
jgi:hypothetical protein